jgi:hypothetical protein
MIIISFVINNVSEDKATQLLHQIADQTIACINKVHLNAIIAGTPRIYRRESDKPGEPALTLVSRTLEHYLWASATALDEPPHKTWTLDIQCPTHSIAIPDKSQPKVHTLKPDQVSTLLQNLAQRISQLVDVEVSYNDDHTRHGVIYHHGTPTKDEHW